MTYSSIRVKRLTTTLGCSLSLVQQIWQRLHMDINEDPNELIELKAIVKQYRSLLQSTDRISAKVDSLPDNEKDRLHVEGGQLIQKIKDLRLELHLIRFLGVQELNDQNRERCFSASQRMAVERSHPRAHCHLAGAWKGSGQPSHRVL